jgi:hypothetical protein
MSNFFFFTSDGFAAINIDLIKEVISDEASGRVTIFFDREHTVELKGDTGKEFIDVLTRLKSEARLAVGALKREKAAKKSEPKKPKPPSRSRGAFVG